MKQSSAGSDTPALRESLKRALSEVFRNGRYADRAIQFEIRARPRWTSAERRSFAECVYDVTRWWRMLNWLAGQKEFDGTGIAEKNLNPSHLDKTLDAYFQNHRSGKDMPPAILHSLPDWLEEFGRGELGAEWNRVMDFMNQPAPLFLRVNKLKSEVDRTIKNLAAEGLEARAVEGLSDALVLRDRANVFMTQEFKEEPSKSRTAVPK